MPTQDDRDNARRVAYIRKRALVRKLHGSPSRLAVDRMSTRVLWAQALEDSTALVITASGRTDPEGYLRARNLLEILQELEMRGVQLELDFSDSRA